MLVLGHRRRTQRWRRLLRLPCRGRSRRRLAGVDKFRARPFGQIRIDERQFRTERLDRESVPGEARGEWLPPLDDSAIKGDPPPQQPPKDDYCGPCRGFAARRMVEPKPGSLQVSYTVVRPRSSEVS
jgi:hypothetical protein